MVDIVNGVRSKAKPGVGMAAHLGMNDAVFMPKRLGCQFKVECFDKDGNLKWVEDQLNIVTNVGLNEILDKFWKGSTYTASFFVGLKLTGNIVAGDTLASHAGWTEFTNYTGNRQALVLGTVASQSVNSSASPASFPITGTGAVTGAFAATVASGTSGILIGGAEFSATRNVINGDTLNVTVTATAASA